MSGWEPRVRQREFASPAYRAIKEARGMEKGKAFGDLGTSDEVVTAEMTREGSGRVHGNRGEPALEKDAIRLLSESVTSTVVTWTGPIWHITAAYKNDFSGSRA